MKPKTENKTEPDQLKPLLVTTGRKGVFFGYGTPSSDDTIVLKRAQMCVYWSKEMRGVLGLAGTGPDEQCRISRAVPELILREVTSVTETTPEAAAKWESAPWS